MLIQDTGVTAEMHRDKTDEGGKKRDTSPLYWISKIKKTNRTKTDRQIEREIDR